MDSIKAKSSAELYTKVYDQVEGYGVASKNHCPGVRLFPHYKEFLAAGPILDLGCGTGDTVLFLRERGYPAFGLDWIPPRIDLCKQADVTKRGDYRKYKTAMAWDVIEHLNNAQVKGLFLNMMQCDVQMFTIANTPSITEVDGVKVDLHINIKTFDVWRGLISDMFHIVYECRVRSYQTLYVCERKKNLANPDLILVEYLRNKGYEVKKSGK